MITIKSSVATVYHGGGRRWLTRKAAERAEAKRLYRERFPCECEAGEPLHGDGGERCGYHDDHHAKFVRRVARLIKAAR